MPVRRSRIVRSEAQGELAESLAALRRSLGVPGDYPAAAEAEAEAAARDVPTDPQASGLADLRDIEFLTIDPEGSTDLDQALHLERTASGAVLHYAIADVPAFVSPGGALDAETRLRGQTLYAPDGRIPLHPVVLSEDAASLLPDVDRRAFVWRFVLDEGARPVETTLTRAIVRSRRQWNYEDAQAAVDDGSGPESLTALAWFGGERAAREHERGGASLNLPETSIVPDPEGYHLEVSDGVAMEDWNAHISLLTGMAAAAIMLRGGIGILRTMPPARAEDVEEFRAQTVALGLPWAQEVSYGDYLNGLGTGPAAHAVREYAGGLFRGAAYTAFDGPAPAETMQAAIGAPYAHTTAPLRRLVDRWSLVICEALANGREVPAWARESLAEVPGLMARSAQRAGKLDAGALDRVEAALMQGHEGEEFEGVVLRTQKDAAHVQLDRPPIRVRVAGVDARAGSTVRLRLDAVDIAEGTLTFTPAR